MRRSKRSTLSKLGFAPPAQAAGDIDLCVTVGRTAGFTGENFVIDGGQSIRQA